MRVAFKGLFIVCLFLILGRFVSIAQMSATYKKILQDTSVVNNPSRYSAALFLLKAVPSQYSLDGDIIKKYDSFFDVLADIQSKRNVVNDDQEVQIEWEKYVERYGEPSTGSYGVIQDSIVLDKETLLSSINGALKVKSEKQWLSSIPDSIFNNYLLPYRIGYERIEPYWRDSLYTYYNFLKKKGRGKQYFDKIKNSDMLAFANEIQYEVQKKVSSNVTMWRYPFDIPISKMEKGKQGACKHLSEYNLAVMRACGIPAAIDFSLLWGNHRNGHQWNVIIQPDNKVLPFDAAAYPLALDLVERKIVKIYRKEFNYLNPITRPPLKDVPTFLYDAKRRDVTEQYTKTFNVQLKVPAEIPLEKDYLLLGTFNNSSWVPQAYAPILNRSVSFERMGSNNVYIGMFLDSQGEYQTFGSPFILDTLGRINELFPSIKKAEFKLTRKYPLKKATQLYMESMVGGALIGANNADFSDSVTLMTIEQAPSMIETRKLMLEKEFRYLKYRSSLTQKRMFVAELEFYDKLGQKILIYPMGVATQTELERVTDGDPATYFWGKPGSSICFDFEKPTQISKIKFAPRSDTNFILVGDTYELCYWANGRWKSHNTIVADEPFLIFNNVPQGTLYILHNLTKGAEERIFTLENGKQIWW